MLPEDAVSPNRACQGPTVYGRRHHLGSKEQDDIQSGGQYPQQNTMTETSQYRRISGEDDFSFRIPPFQAKPTTHITRLAKAASFAKSMRRRWFGS